MKKAAKRAAEILVALLFWGAVWYLLSLRDGTGFILPDPVSVLRRLWELVRTLAFYKTVGTSLTWIGIGYLAGVAGGVLLALAAWKLYPVKVLFDPLMSVIRATPVVSFILILLLVFTKIEVRHAVPALIAALLILPVVWQNTLLGLNGLDPKLAEMARVYRVTGWKRFFRMELPQVWPAVKAAMLTGLGLARKAGVAAEVLAQPANSIGAEINSANLGLAAEDKYAWTLAIIVISLLMEALFKFLFGKAGEKRDRNP